MNAIDIRPATLRDLSYVTAHLRDVDAREIRCQLPEGTASAEIAALSLAGTEHAYCCWWRGSPVAGFGATPASYCGSVWTAWAFGTKRFVRAAPAIGRFARTTLAPVLIAKGARRVEARSIAGHDKAHAWLERLGARREAELRDWGRGGETFVLWAWTEAELTAGQHVPKATY